jgi:hypothetical protein
MHTWMILDEYRPVAISSRNCHSKVPHSMLPHRHFDLESRAGVGAIGDEDSPTGRLHH